MRAGFLTRLLAPPRPPSRQAAEPVSPVHTPGRQPAPLEISEYGLLKGKTALLTGAAGLVGSGIAHALAGQGANVYCCDIDGPRQQRLIDDLSGYGVRVEGYHVDISQPSQVDQLGEALDQMGVAVDILVHSAGLMTPRAPFLRQRTSAWSELFQTNVTGALQLTQRVCGGMTRRGAGGSIIFITSIHQSTVWGEVGYGASKAALAAAVRELALDLAPHGIRVNGIAPGAVGRDDQGRALPHPPTPLRGKMITPAAVGRAAVFLASEYFSESITGTVLGVDGGLSLHTYLSMAHTV